MKLDEILVLKKRYDEAVNEHGEAAFRDAVAALFDAFPKVRTLLWTQYTPGFNDGDPCVHHRNEMAVTLDLDDAPSSGKEQVESSDHDTDEEEDEEEYEDDEDDGLTPYDLRERGEAELATMLEALDSVPEELTLSLFGDNVCVTYNRDDLGPSVEDYDCGY